MQIYCSALTSILYFIGYLSSEATSLHYYARRIDVAHYDTPHAGSAAIIIFHISLDDILQPAEHHKRYRYVTKYNEEIWLKTGCLNTPYLNFSAGYGYLMAKFRLLYYLF